MKSITFSPAGKVSTLLAVFILFFSGLNAQNWTGNINSDWNNAGNWTGWPLGGDDILIDPVNYTGAALHPVISTNSVFIPDAVLIQNGAQVTVNANLSANGRIELLNAGTSMTINAGTVHASGSGSQARFIVAEDAQVTVNGGILRSNDRILAELGGIIIQNSGTVNPMGELALVDGSALGSSLYDMNGGTLTIGVDFTFENEAGLFYPTFDMSAGTLTIGGALGWLGVAPGAGTPRFIMNGGVGIISGNILNDPASTIDLFMNIGGTASLSFSGSSIDLIHATDSILMWGASTFTINNTAAWNNAGVLHATGGTVMVNGNTALHGTGSYQFAGLVINAGKTLNQLTSTISVWGNYTNNGTFTPNIYTVTFNGTSPQSISGGSTTTFTNFVLNHTSSGGVTLNKDIIITGSLQLDAGKMNTSAAAKVNLTDNATTSAGSPTSFVNGPFRKVGDDPFVFPIGKNDTWARAAITAPSSVSAEVVAEYFDAGYSNTTSYSSPLSAVSNIEYWSIQSAGTSPVALRLFWEDATGSAITDCTELTIAGWDGAQWNNVPSAATGLCTGTGSGSIMSSAPVTPGIYTFGYFGDVTTQNFTVCAGESITVGANTYTSSGTYVDILTASDMSDSVVSTQLTVLPQNISNEAVSLCLGDSLVVGSNTYYATGTYADTLVAFNGCDSIVNTDLTIQGLFDVSVVQSGLTLSANNASADAYQWINCATGLPVAGGSSQSYTATANGSYAVVITMNDCADTSACFAISSVGIAEAGNPGLHVFPNPSSGKITVQVSQPDALLRLVSLSGQLLSEEKISSLSTELDYSGQVPGIYFLEIIRGNEVSRIKLIRY